MKTNQTFSSHHELKTKLKLMKGEINQIKSNIESDSKSYVAKIPKRLVSSIFNKKVSHKTLISNPIGNALANTINGSLLKKENFITKILMSLLFKQVGKKIENRLVNSKKKNF